MPLALSIHIILMQIMLYFNFYGRRGILDIKVLLLMYSYVFKFLCVDQKQIFASSSFFYLFRFIKHAVASNLFVLTGFEGFG